MIRRLLSALHEALDVARLARAVRILSREKAALAVLAVEQEERADREKAHADLMSADLDNKRAELEQVRRERDEAVAALELRDAGAEIRRARVN